MDAGPHERGREVRTRLLSRGSARSAGLSRSALSASLLATAIVAALPGAASASPVGSPAPGPTQTGRLLVTLDAQASPAATRSLRAGGTLLRSAGVTVDGPVDPTLRLVTVRPPLGTPLTVAAAALRALPGVARVDVERRAQLRQFVPNDPALTQPETQNGTPAGIPIEWWAAGENLPAMWGITRGRGALIAIIDSGADATHPELASKIAGTIDNDATVGHAGAGVDESGHGTHVASLACGAAGNGIGLAGAGLDCRLLIIKSDLSDASIATSIRQAVDRGADAINMSFGTDGSVPAAAPVAAAIDYAYRKGVILVSAAADDPTDEQGDPSNVLQPTGSGAEIAQGKGLSVTSASYSGQRSPFAGYGSQISLAAYGSFDARTGPRGIFGAFPAPTVGLERPAFGSLGCGCRATFGGDDRYAYVQGTSMASPMVAAVAGVLRHFNPDVGAPALLELMKRTATRPAGTGWTPDLGWGIVNGGAAAAVLATLDRTPPRTSVKSTTPKVVSGPTLTLRFNLLDRGPTGVRVSGYRSLQLWRSTNGGRAVRIADTTRSSYRITLRRGSRYRFYTRGLDRAGNREAAPARPDVAVRRR